MAPSGPHPAPRPVPSGTVGPTGEDPARAAASDQVVALFAEADGAAPAAPPAIDWPAAIDLIRDVGARVRRAQDVAQEASRHARSIVQRGVTQMEEAERRVDLAEARADRAEAVARLSEARAKLAERQAEEARASEAEARLWLRRVHASLTDEFQGLIDAAVDPAADERASPASG